MGKAPAFQFYASDFLTGTNEMTVDEVGIYIRLLATSWDKGPLPMEPSRLARVAGADIDRFIPAWQVVRKKWKKTKAGYVNERLEMQRGEREAFAAKQAEKANKRWNSNATAQPRQSQARQSRSNALQSSDFSLQSSEQQIPSQERSEKRARQEALTAEFLTFWAKYPNKAGKDKALKVWLRLAPDSGLILRILDSLSWQVRQPKWLKDDGEYVPHASSWLNQRRWEDEPFNAPAESRGPRVMDADETMRVLKGQAS